MINKKKIFTFSVILVLLMTLILPANITAASAWNLVWGDEFNGTTLNSSDWNYDIGNGVGGWGNNELEYYTSRTNNVQVTNGNLVITALKEAYNGYNYTSGKITTKGKKNFTFGKIEARIKIPTGQGIWPAFWMLGSNIDSVKWPACGEIDIMEHVNNNANNNGTIHWDLNGHQYYGQTSAALDYSQYHTYSIEWDKNSIKWFVDGNKYCEGNISGGINGTEEFQKPFYLIFNLAVGGDWPGSPNATTVFPAKMYVDYVRVYSTDQTPTGSAKWYLNNTTVSGTTPVGQNMQTEKSGTTGWQPTKTVTSTSSYWYAPIESKNYGAGTWKFNLWTNSPGGASNVRVDLYRTNANGDGATLIGTSTKDINASGTGNHQTTYTFTTSSATSLNNQRLMVKVTLASGTPCTMAYNTNDFPTMLITP